VSAWALVTVKKEKEKNQLAARKKKIAAVAILHECNDLAVTT